MIRLKKKTIVIIILLGVFISFGSFAFVNLGNWLLVKSDTFPDSLFAVLCYGDDIVRREYNKKLIKKIKSSKWVLSGQKYDSLKIKSENSDLSLTIVDSCKSTWEESCFFIKWLELERKKLKKYCTLNVGVVSSPYHMRRISIILKSISDNRVKFYYIPVPLENYKWTNLSFSRWWKDKYIKNRVYREFFKIIGDSIKCFLYLIGIITF